MNNLINEVYLDIEQFSCSKTIDDCENKEKTMSLALYVQVPDDQQVVPEEVFKECCYNHKVFASSSDLDPYKNDFSGFYHKRQITSETCKFILIQTSNQVEHELNDSTFGIFKNFGSIANEQNLTTFVLDWKKVLNELGEGSYKVVKRVNLIGIEKETQYLVYSLSEYSSLKSDKTVRIDVTMSGLLEKENIDFTDSDFKDSIRVPGFFGRRDPTFEEDNLIDRNYQKRQISMKQTNEYKFQTNLIPECVTSLIYDFLLFSQDIRVNDYNLNNHSYKYKDFLVKLENNEGTRYLVKSRKASLNLVFSDKYINNNKRNY